MTFDKKYVTLTAHDGHYSHLHPPRVTFQHSSLLEARKDGVRFVSHNATDKIWKMSKSWQTVEIEITK
jgi:hypothetical protein